MRRAKASSYYFVNEKISIDCRAWVRDLDINLTCSVTSQIVKLQKVSSISSNNKNILQVHLAIKQKIITK